MTDDISLRDQEEKGGKEKEEREGEQQEGNEEESACWFHPSSLHFVPLMLCSSDFVNSFAAGLSCFPLPFSLSLPVPFFLSFSLPFSIGMTVKFFPLFFQYSCGMSPLGISFVYFLTPLAVAIGFF